MTLYDEQYSAGISKCCPQRGPNGFHPRITTPYSDSWEMIDQWVTDSSLPGDSRLPILIIPPRLSEMIERYLSKRKLKYQKVVK